MSEETGEGDAGRPVGAPASDADAGARPSDPAGPPGKPLPDDPAELPADPLELLRSWLDEARAQGMRDPGAMTLATAGADGRPSARTVLLRGVDERGLSFHTNRGLA